MATIEDLLPALVLFGLIAIVGAVVALILQGFILNSTVQASNTYTLVTTPSSIAQNDVAANALVATISGSDSWISPSDPITVTITGNIIASYATNTVYATQSATTNTISFILTYYSGANTLCTSCGNFYNISKVSFSGSASQYQSAPSITLSVSQNFESVTHGSAPQTFNSNSITSTHVLSVTLGNTYNSLTNGLNSIQTLTSFLSLIALVIVAAVIIGIVLVAFSFSGNGGTSL